MEGLLTDDMDIRDTKLSMDIGGNGDYYLKLTETKSGKKVSLDFRMAMSGGNASPEVKHAFVELYKALDSSNSSRLKDNFVCLSPGSCIHDNDDIPCEECYMWEGNKNRQAK